MACLLMCVSWVPDLAYCLAFSRSSVQIVEGGRRGDAQIKLAKWGLGR